MSLIGIPEVDLEILMAADDPTLFSICQTNRYAYSLCQDEYFWKQRLISRYGTCYITRSITYQQQYLDLTFMSTDQGIADQRVDILNTRILTNDQLVDLHLTGLDDNNSKTIEWIFINYPDFPYHDYEIQQTFSFAEPTLIQLMLDRGFEPDVEALSEAIINGDVEKAKWLVDRGVDLWVAAAESYDNYESPAIDEAVYHGHQEMFNWLTQKGINPTEWTMEMARQGGHSDLYEQIRRMLE